MGVHVKSDCVKLRHWLREREIQVIFGHVPENTFGEVLELGSGDGHQSRLLARYVKKLHSTDLNSDRLLREPHPKIIYETCDAEDLPYEAERFDLIYSSNLLEHLPTPEKAIVEMYRVLKNDGIMIHVVPSRFWKILHLGLFHASRITTMGERLLNGRNAVEVRTKDNNLKRGNSKQRSFLSRNLWPAVHGEFPNHFAEYKRMSRRHWVGLFTETGFDVLGFITDLPVHSPYRFGLNRVRRVLEYVGFSTSNGYILAKKGCLREKAATFWMKR